MNNQFELDEAASTISGLTSGPRINAPSNATVSATAASYNEHVEGQVELDTHADTCMLGKTFAVLEDTGQRCEVTPWSDSYKSIKNIAVVKGGTALDTYDGKTVILVFNNGLSVPEEDKSLLCVNQMRAHGVIVDDRPRQWPDENGCISTHSIYIPEADLRIPLRMHGVISYFDTRLPTQSEIQNCEWIEMTSSATWDPHSDQYSTQEMTFEQREDQGMQTRRSIYALRSGQPETVHLSAVSSTLVEDEFLRNLEATVKVTLASTATGKRSNEITAEVLAKRWGVGLDTARNTLKVTTQKGIRSFTHPLHRRYRTKQQQLRYNTLNTKFYSDTFFATTASIHGNTCAQMFINDVDFQKVYPMKKKGDAGQTLATLFSDVGVPSWLHTDNAKELTQAEWKRVRDIHSVQQTEAEPYTPWQNRAESGIRENKKSTKRMMQRTQASPRLWDYATVYTAETRNLTAHGTPQLNGRTPHEITTGHTPDISEWLQYDWYEPIWYYDSEEPYPGDSRKCARWLGVAHRIGQALCYWVLPESGNPIARSTIQCWTTDEVVDPTMKLLLAAYDKKIAERLRTVGFINEEIPLGLMAYDPDEDDVAEPFDTEAAMPEADDYDVEAFDKYLTAQVLLPHGDGMSRATVASRKRDTDGNPIGKANANPLLDTRIYEVQFDDGVVGEYAANLIAESLYAQVDEEGNEFLLMQEIVDHERLGDAIARDDMWTTGHNGNKHKRRTTKGWKLLVQWKDGTTSWTRLADLKESHPVQVAEYAVANKLAEEAAFAWWVSDVLRKRDRIISKVKSRYWKRTHKYGIEVPKSVDQALAIDNATGTSFWKKAIEKEMLNVMPAFKFLEEGESIPVGYQKIMCHMIFDVKLDFTRKARFVAGGHTTDPPACTTYASVVSRESVRLAFLLAALNDLDVLSADIGNAYLNAPCREKIYTLAGKEFGPTNEGKVVIIVRALYGLKSSGAAWRAHLAQAMHDLDFRPCEADPDVWMKAAVTTDGLKYWEYVLIYTDDLLVISEKPAAVMESLAKLYRLKEDPVTKKKYARPERYLGATIGQYRFDEEPNKVRWSMSSDEYIGNAIRDVETKLSEKGRRLSTKVSTPLSQGYRPELDVSKELNDEDANYYQNLIGILRWSVELGRIDIHVSVALMSSYSASPRIGHLEEVLRIFAYLKKHDRSRMVFDDNLPSISDERFKTVEWADFYPDAAEPRSTKEPQARGREVKVYCFVDADHAGNQVTRRSHTGVLIFVNKAPILWYSKRQNTVETSTFGSEFIAIKIATELIQALRYKLRMMGVPIDGPTDVFCDNDAVVKNTTMPESSLKKKHQAIAFHRVREAAAAGMIRIAKEDTETNLADLLTKPLAGPRLKNLVSHILY